MTDYHPRLAATASSSERMDALCEFVEFWLGRRTEEYGEPSDRVNSRSLPAPLRKLYAFAGRWPALDNRRQSQWAVGAFSHQDCLRPLDQLEKSDEHRIKFVDENQGCWVCSTLTAGDDPPVWCDGDLYDENGEPAAGEKLVCDSLSKFLVTFVLQEITCGSHFFLCDDGLSEQFENSRTSAITVWERGPYVYGSDASFYLWNGVLVANQCGSYSFGANHEQGIAFLSQHQGPVETIELMAGLLWRLAIARDGAARLRYSEWPTEAEGNAKVGTFDFAELLRRLSEQASSDGHADNNPTLFLFRAGQSYSSGKHLPNHRVVTELFWRTLENVEEPSDELSRLFRERWPY